MIRIQELKFEPDKFCVNCGNIGEDMKNIKFSVKNSLNPSIAICLCKKCRHELAKLLEEE